MKELVQIVVSQLDGLDSPLSESDLISLSLSLGSALLLDALDLLDRHQGERNSYRALLEVADRVMIQPQCPRFPFPTRARSCSSTAPPPQHAITSTHPLTQITSHSATAPAQSSPLQPSHLDPQPRPRLQTSRSASICWPRGSPPISARRTRSRSLSTGSRAGPQTSRMRVVDAKCYQSGACPLLRSPNQHLRHDPRPVLRHPSTRPLRSPTTMQHLETGRA